MADINKRILILALFGAIVSSYLVYHHVNVVGGYNLGQSLCNVSSSFNCDDVAKSKYSSLFGIPVASFGLFYFLLLAYISAKLENSRLNLICFSVLVALLPSAFLLFQSIFVIKKFCLFCMLLDLILISVLFLSYKYLKLGEVFRDCVSLLKPKFLFFTFLAGLFSFSLPSLLKSFVFEAALDDSEISKVYSAWNSNEFVDLEINCSGDASGDFCKGRNDAKVTIVEFSDFQCPFCKLAAYKINQIYNKNVELGINQVRVVFKNFPLDVQCNDLFETAPHELACQAAIFARCAGAQGKFWEYHNSLFSLDYLEWKMENILAISDQLNLDTEKINKCASDKNTLVQTKKDVNLGNKIGITSTPTIFINGKKVKLDRLDQLEKLIEKILGKSFES